MASARAIAAGAAAAVVVVDRHRTRVTGPQHSILPSGIRVVTERMPEARSVSVGVWVGIGSRDEAPAMAGASHFLEHLLFKGTSERSARSIAVGVDSVGGEMNAFTAREHTVYYTRLPVAELRFGLDLLTDVVSSPAFRPDEVDAEREVILEEILMNEDTPDDVVVTALYEALFPDHPIGRETLGSRTSIEDMARDDIATFHRSRYQPDSVVVAAAGDLHHDEIVSGIAGLLADADRSVPADVAGVELVDRMPPTGDVVPLTVIHRPTEQAHVTIGWRGLAYDDDDRYALAVANHVLGGGMSSRLFQQVREERGLAYTVFSSPSSYQDTGSLMVYAGTAPDHLDEVLTVIDGVTSGLAADGVTEDEHRVAVGYLVGSMLLGLEDSGSRMGRLGSGMIVRNEVIPVEEHVARIQAVTVDDVARVTERVFGGQQALAVVGPFDADDAVFATRS